MKLVGVGCGAVLVGVSLVGCLSSKGPASEPAINDLTEARTITIGRCDLPTDAPVLLPPAMIGSTDPLTLVAPPSADGVLSRVELKAKVAIQDGKRTVEKITATVARGAATGTLTFVPGNNTFYRTFDGSACEGAGCGDPNRRAESIGYFEETSPGGAVYTCGTDAEACSSKLTLGSETTYLNRLLLQRESTGGQWLVLGYGADGQPPRVVATAPGCTFDESAWKLLWNDRCAEVDGGSDAGWSCTPASDGGADASDAATDSAKSDARADAGDAGKKAPPASKSEAEPEEEEDPVASSGGLRPLPRAAAPAKPESAASTCSFSAAPSASGVVGFGLLAVAAALVSSRRRARPRA